ncbi:hypothetical protein L1987_49435 [Smallanthus sonchifolius]|uniref:Uncharacterized protein n=1 Tax=Smallanthus sonchifolius TaxID=185202 RepID=A0ACB9FUI0_9ASTR|nr:hypothetical protein L1987_49435 [Smallanthus sonchifolius]
MMVSVRIGGANNAVLTMNKRFERAFVLVTMNKRFKKTFQLCVSLFIILYKKFQQPAQKENLAKGEIIGLEQNSRSRSSNYI